MELGDGYLEKDRFNELLSVVKDLEGKDYDSIAKRWTAPLTESNLTKLELILSEEDYNYLEGEIE